MDNSTRQQLFYEAHRKSTGLAYLLWFLFGGFGVHRFYLDQKGTGIAQLLLLLLGWIPIGLGWLVLAVWLIVDLFLIPDMSRRFNVELIGTLDEVRAQREGGLVPARRLDRLELR
jgi:TM2 domain-containing membrane protein YozV